MKFFIARSDAAEGLESSEEVFDAVAFTIEMLVKVGFFGSAGVYGYDGDATELVHISADGVAVVALVHYDKSVRFEVCLQQRFALIKVGNVGASEDETERITQRIAGEVNFGRETRPGATHCMGKLATAGASRVLVDAHARAVDHEILIVAMLSTQTDQQGLPPAIAGPAAKRRIHTLPLTEDSRQIPPRSSRAQNPQNRLDLTAFARGFASPSVGATQAVPMLINFFSSSQCRSLRTNLNGWFTEYYGESSESLASLKYPLNGYFSNLFYFKDTP